MEICFMCYNESVELKQLMLYKSDSDLYVCPDCYQIVLDKYKKESNYIRGDYTKSRELYRLYVKRQKKLKELGI